MLLEELVFYKEELGGAENFKVAMAYSVLIALVVSLMALLYLKLSGPMGRGRLRAANSAARGRA